MNFLGFEQDTSRVGSEVLTAVVMKCTNFWNITLATCFHTDVFRDLFDPEDGGDVPPKRRLTFNGLHGVIYQKIVLFRIHHSSRQEGRRHWTSEQYRYTRDNQ
jgi:hypothetical protein